jgi:cytochrome o ubiquinol oxidase operon protein cyoD
MSQSVDVHEGGAHHAHDDHDGGIHATLGGYVVGFVLSVVLTAIPFWLVMQKVFPSAAVTTVLILAFGAVQIVVHMIYFLHMNSKAEGGWSLMAMVFTLILVVITLTGSLWVMYHLKSNMMPMSAQQVRNLP